MRALLRELCVGVLADYSRIFAAILCVVWDNRTLDNTVTNMIEFEPYSFEPMRDFSDSDGEITADGQHELARRGNTSWWM